MKRIYFVIITLFVVETSYSQDARLFDWNTDLDYLAKEMPQKHYNFFTVKSKADFIEGLATIKAQKDHLSDYATAIKVQQLIAGFGDSHSSLNYSPLIHKSMVLPIQTYWFSDGLFILETTSENAEILGHRIISVNKTPLETVVDSLATLITMDNQAMLKKTVPMLLPDIQMLKTFGFVDGEEVELGLRNVNGCDKTYLLKPGWLTKNNKKTVRVDSLALCDRNKSYLFIDSYLPVEKIYYLQYNKCWSKELHLQWRDKQEAEQLPSFKEFEDRVFRKLEAEPIDKIVFDMRYNGGGNSLQGTKFAERLSTYLAKNQEVKVYVVLGRATFSSAILNAMDFQRLTNAIFIGEETAGKPNHFGEVRSFSLPVSKLKIQYSSKYFKRSEKNVNTIVPDVRMETSFSDYIKGIDPVYEWISQL